MSPAEELAALIGQCPMIAAGIAAMNEDELLLTVLKAQRILKQQHGKLIEAHISHREAMARLTAKPKPRRRRK